MWVHLRTPSILRWTSLVVLIAFFLGHFVLPGLTGRLSNAAMLPLGLASSIVSNFAMLLLLVQLFVHVQLFARLVVHGGVLRWVAVLLGSASFAFAVPVFFFANFRPQVGLPSALATFLLLLVIGASLVRSKLVGAFGFSALLLAFAGAVRVVGWWRTSADGHVIDHFQEIQFLGLLASLFEWAALGSMLIWLFFRRSWSGALLASALFSAAFFSLSFATSGPHNEGQSWHLLTVAAERSSALPLVPVALGLGATYHALSYVIAGALALVPAPWSMVSCAGTLLLVASGSLDAPIRALSAGVAALWILYATIDPSTRWLATGKPLPTPRNRKLPVE